MATCLNLIIGTSFSLGLIIPGIFPWRLHFHKSVKLLTTNQRCHLESKTQELAKKLGILKPVEVIEVEGFGGIAQAIGCASLPGKIGIVINPSQVNKISNDELEFVIAHELSHIKANDLLRMGTASLLASVITTLAMSILFPSSAIHFATPFLAPFSPATIIAVIVSGFTFFIFSQWREEGADKLGYSVCSQSAKKAAPQFFENLRVSQLKNRNKEGSNLSKLWRRFLVREEGNLRFDIYHPPLTTRINYLTT